MTAPIDPDRLVKLCGMFGSHHDGEVFNAARMADRLVRAAGLTWADVIKAPAKRGGSDNRERGSCDLDWHELRAFCLRNDYLLSTKEYAFLLNLGRWRGELTPKQSEWLEAIYDRLQREAA